VWANNGGPPLNGAAWGRNQSYGPVNLRYGTGGADGNWSLVSETHYLYDGNRVIQERDGNNTPTVSYTRGSDLSGGLEGAGGIGGLLARSHGYSAGSWTVHNFYHADGNGNITMLIDNSTTPTITAAYRYDPFGNTISSSGSLAGANIYRFSSKEMHVHSGLYYYGYRFYDPNLQRWLNRDPIEERGGINLYSFVRNDPVDWIDYLGLELNITIRRYVGPAGHQWISDGNNNIGFYPGKMFGAPGKGVWVNEDQFTGQINANGGGRPDPSNPNNYYEWDTKKKNHGKMPDGTPCSAATRQKIIDCINSAISANPAPKFKPLLNNCRQQSKRTLGDCCLSQGSMTHKPPGGRGGAGRSTGDTTGGSSELTR
jgi:RHS repeat-associated protein